MTALTSKNTLSQDAVRNVLQTFPRCPLAYLPTPLEPLKRLSRRLGINLLIKRDDLTGLALGGNKARKLEFLVADALAKRADSIITWAGVQSNWCRQLAAAASKMGIQPILLLLRRPDLPADFDGNLLLDHVCGASIHFHDLEANRKMMELSGVRDLIGTLVEEEKSAGRKPYVAPIGGSLIEGSMTKPLGALSYVNAFLELVEQAEEAHLSLDHVVLATGSGGTHAGLVAGAQLLSPKTKVIGINVSEEPGVLARYAAVIARETLGEFTANASAKGVLRKEEMVVFDEYVGRGYGVPDAGTTEAIRLLAETEGILAEPVYTGKALAALLDLVRRGYFRPQETVVFLHTGGAPLLFVYRDAFHCHINR